MCSITELARAKQKIKGLELQIVELEKRHIPKLEPEPEPKPEIRRFEVLSNILSDELDALMVKQLYGLLDYSQGYYHTDLAGWYEAFRWIYLTQEPPKTALDAKGKWNTDCEDWAIWLKAMVNTHFGLNAIFIVIGDMPLGRHGFTQVRAEDGHWLWEPQPAFDIQEFFRIMDEKKYRPLYSFG